MNIMEYADILNLEIVIRYYPNQDCRFSTHFDGVELKEGCMLASASGEGETPEKSMADYIRKIAGKLAVKGAYTDHRQEFTVPKTLVTGAF